MTPQLQDSMALRDIHLPDAVSWWPPAIGWWILLAVILLSIYFIPKLYRWLTFIPLHKVTNEAFLKIEDEYRQHQDNTQLAQSLSKLLRQISMTYHGREKVAHLTGEKWVDSLNTLTEKDYFSSELKNIIIHAPYQKNNNIDTTELLDVTQQWINALPKKANINKTHKAHSPDIKT